MRIEGAKSCITRHQPGFFNLALGSQHPVKGVSVFIEIAARQQTVLPRYRQMFKTIGFDQLMELLQSRFRDGEFAQPEFGRDFPHTRRTDENRVALFGNRFARGD